MLGRKEIRRKERGKNHMCNIS